MWGNLFGGMFGVAARQVLKIGGKTMLGVQTLEKQIPQESKTLEIPAFWNYELGIAEISIDGKTMMHTKLLQTNPKDADGSQTCELTVPPCLCETPTASPPTIIKDLHYMSATPTFPITHHPKTHHPNRPSPRANAQHIIVRSG